MNKGPLLFFVVIALSQTGAWIQQFSHLRWDWFRNNQWFNIIFLGALLGAGFVFGARIGYDTWGSAWKVRLLQFSVGTFVVTFMNFLLLGEGIGTKNMICIFLSFLIIAIQIFWK